MYCVKCGSQIQDDVNFCPFCGTRVRTDQNSRDEETQISRLRRELNKSRRKTKVVEILSAIVIVILLIQCWSYYNYCDVLLRKSQAAFSELESKVEESKFYFYYDSYPKQRYGVDDLESYLDRWQWIEGTYVRNKFDCSEMSAYIERNLENEGYHTIIVVGYSPSNQTERHAWLLVETSSGKYMPVEATHYALVKWDNPHFDLYFEYDHEFETISDALEYDYESFNWWES